MMKQLPIVALWKAYPPFPIVISSLVGLLFFVLYGGIIITPIIMISMLYAPFMMYFLLIIYVALSLIVSYSMGRVMETLQYYTNHSHVEYDTIQTRITVGIAILIFIALSIVYLQYFA